MPEGIGSSALSAPRLSASRLGGLGPPRGEIKTLPSNKSYIWVDQPDNIHFRPQ